MYVCTYVPPTKALTHHNGQTLSSKERSPHELKSAHEHQEGLDMETAWMTGSRNVALPSIGVILNTVSA
jgi:hypothetical protein